MISLKTQNLVTHTVLWANCPDNNNDMEQESVIILELVSLHETDPMRQNKLDLLFRVSPGKFGIKL